MVSDSEEEDEEEEEPEEEEEEDDDEPEIVQSSGGNPIPIILNPSVRPMYNVNNSPNPMNVVRPIIINGVQVGTYTRPANPMNMRPGNPGNPNMSGPYVVRPMVNPGYRPV